jgi:hopene-associated glycosyltransferase HpnB
LKEDNVIVIALTAIAAWVILLCFRGEFWRPVELRQPVCQEKSLASVVAVIRARNEAEMITETLRSLFAQDYEGNVHIVLVDDHSNDKTADIARQFTNKTGYPERLTIVQGSALPPGWTGKLWAVHQGLAEARRHNPDFILLTDADISHAPDSLKQCVLHAVKERADLVSLMVRLHCRSMAEKALIPAFVFFFFMLYPPRWVADRQRSTAAAAGGCMLVRPHALDKIGGIEAVRGSLIDDCALAKAIKQSGGDVRLYATRTTSSTRHHENIGELWSMIARSAFTQLKYSWPLLIVAILGMGVIFIAPPLLVLFDNDGFVRTAGLVAWITMFVAFQRILRLYDRSPAWGLTLPAIALFYVATTLRSAIKHCFGKGGGWKGRVYSTYSLKNGAFRSIDLDALK